MSKHCCVCRQKIPSHDFAMQTIDGPACSDCLVAAKRSVPPYGPALQRKKTKQAAEGWRLVVNGA
ncbi:hypothetical protein [Desulfovibrio oxyclinae]|jgi:hypothetical protein|uniref:hypothetical protein n=1 Tax=Desulfovibrio oxyclinae TaxID=63560 RepID=UPI00036B5EDA|nr:hypothetical protein [Desulfovibrio oxyclinae]